MQKPVKKNSHMAQDKMATSKQVNKQGCVLCFSKKWNMVSLQQIILQKYIVSFFNSKY